MEEGVKGKRPVSVCRVKHVPSSDSIDRRARTSRGLVPAPDSKNSEIRYMIKGVGERVDVDGSALFHTWILRHSSIGDIRRSRKSLN